jgi:acyl-CoA reductase-like NAD-dependent aldehyde dehydrogenase
VLYRVAELMEGRRAQFAELASSDEVDAAIDLWVSCAGWADKIAAVYGSSNPVAGPYFNFSVPEPTGVVAVLAPEQCQSGGAALLGLVSVLAPVIVSGCTAVVVASQPRPLAAVTLAEVLATSDVPPGVVNVLTGRVAELAPPLASHMDVNAIDVSGAPVALVDELVVAAADNLKRIVNLPGGDPGIERMLSYLEIKTVWHPAAP